MIKKYKDYIILLGVFLLFLFASQINRFLIAINPNLNTSKIVINYDKHLKEELDNIKKIKDIDFNDNLDIITSKLNDRLKIEDCSSVIDKIKNFK